MAKLYVAYGSNLNKEQMRYRCPTAKFVGTGIIEGYELQFKGALHGACATIAPKEGTAVPVGIWTIQKPDEKRLDLYEGYHEHGHSFYDKEQIAVKMDDGSTMPTTSPPDPERSGLGAMGCLRTMVWRCS